MEIDIIAIGVPFAVGCIGGLGYSLIGFMRKFQQDKQTVFDPYLTGTTTLLGGIAGIGMLYLDLDAGVMEELFTIMGAGAVGMKVINMLNEYKAGTTKKG